MIRVANAPCSWGVLEFGLDGETSDHNKVLDEIKETGYKGTELGDWGFMPTQPSVLQEDLSKRELELLGAFVPVALSNSKEHSTGISEALKTAKLMYETGSKNARIVLADDNGTIEERISNAGRISEGMRLNSEQWKVFAEGASQIAYEVKKAYNFETVFHHHCAGYVETPDEIDMLMELTDKTLVGLCLDTGHYQYGGGDPIQALKKIQRKNLACSFQRFQC